MSLKRLIWSGNHYTLQIRRHWYTFFSLTTLCEIRGIGVEKILPEGAGYHIMSIYELCDGAKDYFDISTSWWSFSARLCDQYCDLYVMKRAGQDNTFSIYHSPYSNDLYAVQHLAKESLGYVGPEKWKLT